MKVNWLRVVGIVLLIFSAVAIVLVMTACSSTPDEIYKPKTHEQIWIDAHPTHAGPNGECIEFDDEPCDSDPHDLDDLREARVHRTASPSPKVIKTSSKPAVKPSRRH